MSDPQTICGVCYQRTTLKCNACKHAVYCSSLCQQADWKLHKLICKSMQEFPDSARTSPLHVRGIYFPVSPADARPSFIWLKTEPVCETEDENGRMTLYMAASPGNLLGDDGSSHETRYIQRELARYGVPSYTVCLLMRSAFAYDGSVMNCSIHNNISRGQRSKYKGPFLACGMKGISNDPSTCRDLNTGDLRVALEYLEGHGALLGPYIGPEKKIEAVRINYRGDEVALGKPTFEAVEIPLSHDALHQSDIPQIPAAIYIHLRSHKLTKPKAWEHNNEIGQNKLAEILHLRIKITTANGTGIGQLPASWRTDSPGSVLVWRHDQQPISVAEVKTICKWSEQELQPLFKDYAKASGEEGKINKEQLSLHITDTSFERFRAKMEDGKESV